MGAVHFLEKYMHNYPQAVAEYSAGEIVVKGLPGDKESPLVARAIICDVSDIAHWSHGKWRMPAWPKVLRELKSKVGVTATPELEQRIAWIAKADEAREKANVWREKTVKWQAEWLKRFGVKFKEPPLNHQITSVGYALINPRAALFLDTGLGKTFVAGCTFQALKDIKGLSKFLVVVPKSLIRVAWGEDLNKFTNLTWLDIGDPPALDPLTVCPRCQKRFKGAVPKSHLKTHLAMKIEVNGEEAVWAELYAAYPDMRPASVVPRSERVVAALKRKDVDVFICNPEQVKLNFEAIAAVDWDAVVIDESSMLRNHSSDITQAMIRLGEKVKRKIIMSGTPRPNSSMELWGQMTFLDNCFGSDYSRFRDKFFQVDVTGFKWTEKPGYDAILSDTVRDRSLRYKLENCIDLPGETYEDHEVILSDQLKKHYKEMFDEMYVQLEDETVDVAYKLVQLNKLSQIASGFIYNQDKEPKYLGTSNPKLAETCRVARQLVEDEDRAVVIWIRFSQVEGQAIRDELKTLGVSTLWGGMNGDQIQKSVELFKGGKNKVMVAHPMSAKFGHTWTHATAAIFHSYDYSWENYYQAKRRIYRIGQKNPVTYINIIARGTVDRVIMRALKRKEDESATIIDRNFISRIHQELLSG